MEVPSVTPPVKPPETQRTISPQPSTKTQRLAIQIISRGPSPLPAPRAAGAPFKPVLPEKRG